MLLFDINRYFTKKELELVKNFLIFLDQSMYILYANVTYYIEKLTKENYERYILEIITKNYNL